MKTKQLISERKLERLVGYALERVFKKRDRVHTRSFEEAGVLTTNRGVVLYVDGQEFQVTIVDSTR